MRSMIILILVAVLFTGAGCDSQQDTVTKGREAVKEVVTQPFNTLEGAKDSLNKSEDKNKAAIEQLDKASN